MNEVIVNVLIEAAAGAPELLTGEVAHTATRSRWRCITCTSCNAEYFYRQGLTVTGKADSFLYLQHRKAVRRSRATTERKLDDIIAETGNLHSMVHCPSCGSYELSIDKRAAEDIGETKMKGVLYRCVYIFLLAMATGIAVMVLAGLVGNDYVGHLAMDSILIGAALLLGICFVSPLIERYYTPADINSSELKAKRLAQAQDGVLLRNDFEALTREWQEQEDSEQENDHSALTTTGWSTSYESKSS